MVRLSTSAIRQFLLFAAIAIWPAHLSADIIDFDDRSTGAFGLGFNLYHSYSWGHGSSPGIEARIIPSTSSSAQQWGIGSSATDFPSTNVPTAVSGSQFGYNFGAPQSLFVDFLSPHDVAGAHFAKLFTSSANNATSVTLVGYYANLTEYSGTATLNLTDDFQYLSVNFTGIQYLEIRADSANKPFAIDNLEVSATGSTATPEPAWLPLLAALAWGWKCRLFRFRRSS